MHKPSGERSFFGYCLIVCALLIPQTVWGALPVAVGDDQLPSLAPMLERATPAVVNISTSAAVRTSKSPLLSDPFFRRFFNLPERRREKRTQSLGSGVVVDAKQGYVITNHHVVDKAQEITITLRDGRKLNAMLVGADPETDIAVLKVDPENLVALSFADSDRLRVGDFVVAIGNPFGLGQTVTSGIVSALGRTGLGIEGYEDFVQTDASINPGNSGGALVNLRGQLAGINTAILAPGGGNVGIGFAIPANMVRDIMAQIVTYGEVRRGQLGVAAQDLTPELADAFDLSATRGAVVVKVESGSPADRAGLRPGDIVVKINGRDVHSAPELRNSVGLLRVGQEVRLAVIRDGQRHVLSALIAERMESTLAGKQVHLRLDGAIFGEVVLTSRGNQIPVVAVVDVVKGSIAVQTGLRKGDIITKVNRTRISNLQEFARLIQQNSDSLTITMRRGDSTVYLLIR